MFDIYNIMTTAQYCEMEGAENEVVQSTYSQNGWEVVRFYIPINDECPYIVIMCREWVRPYELENGDIGYYKAHLYAIGGNRDIEIQYDEVADYLSIA